MVEASTISGRAILRSKNDLARFHTTDKLECVSTVLPEKFHTSPCQVLHRHIFRRKFVNFPNENFFEAGNNYYSSFVGNLRDTWRKRGSMGIRSDRFKHSSDQFQVMRLF